MSLTLRLIVDLSPVQSRVLDFPSIFYNTIAHCLFQAGELIQAWIPPATFHLTVWDLLEPLPLHYSNSRCNSICRRDGQYGKNKPQRSPTLLMVFVPWNMQTDDWNMTETSHLRLYHKVVVKTTGYRWPGEIYRAKQSFMSCKFYIYSIILWGVSLYSCEMPIKVF